VVATTTALRYFHGMAETKRKGDLAEAMVMAESLRRGYKVAIPMGEDWRFDLIVLRHGKLDRVQCKYVESNGEVIKVPCKSASTSGVFRYTSAEVDWIAVYEGILGAFFFVSSSFLDSRYQINLRLLPARTNQSKNVLWAKDFTDW